jgi:hypothetical protein
MNPLRSLYDVARCNALLIILLIAGASMPAQQRSLQVVSNHSTAQVFFGTPENPTSFNVGIAKVRGDVQISFGDIGASRFNLTIYPAKLMPSAQLSRNGYGNGYESTISFQSNSVEPLEEGKLKVRGRLTITQVFGARGASPTEFRTSQEVTFVFSGLKEAASASDAGSAGMTLSQKNQRDTGMQVTASTSVNGEAFLELLTTVQDIAWPQSADDETCVSPSAPEEHSGAPCAGTMPPELLPQRGADPPAGNLVTIHLKLILVSAGSDSVGEPPHPEPATVSKDIPR